MAAKCCVPFAALTPVRVSHRAGELVCEEVATVMCSLLAFYQAQGKHARRTRRSSVRHVKVNSHGYSCLCLSSLVRIVGCLRAQD